MLSQPRSSRTYLVVVSSGSVSCSERKRSSPEELMAADTLGERDRRMNGWRERGRRKREREIDISRPHQEIEGEFTSKTHTKIMVLVMLRFPCGHKIT